jgi:hypothetical protein
MNQCWPFVIGLVATAFGTLAIAAEQPASRAARPAAGPRNRRVYRSRLETEPLSRPWSPRGMPLGRSMRMSDFGRACV